MHLINCETNLILTWMANCVITNSTGTRTFATIDKKYSSSNVINSRKYKTITTVEIEIQTDDYLE